MLFFFSNSSSIKFSLPPPTIFSFIEIPFSISVKSFKDFIIIGSAHTLNEIRIKERQNVEQIFLSPLFKTNKSNYKLGVIKFNNLSKLTRKPLIALGGINKNNIKQLKLINVNGFAGITYFNKKKNS